MREAGCRLALEPGRFIVGNAGVLLSKVIYTKREGGKKFVIQDAAMNDLVRPAMYDAFHRIWPARPPMAPPDDFEASVWPDASPPTSSAPSASRAIAWPRTAIFPRSIAGKLLVTFSAGAYGTAMSSNYNSRPRGAEVMVDGNTVRLIRRRETYADLVAHERI